MVKLNRKSTNIISFTHYPRLLYLITSSWWPHMHHPHLWLSTSQIPRELHALPPLPRSMYTIHHHACRTQSITDGNSHLRLAMPFNEFNCLTIHVGYEDHKVLVKDKTFSIEVTHHQLSIRVSTRHTCCISSDPIFSRSIELSNGVYAYTYHHLGDLMETYWSCELLDSWWWWTGKTAFLRSYHLLVQCTAINSLIIWRREGI